MIIGIIMASAYANIKADTATGVMGYLAVAFMSLLMVGSINMNTSIPVVMQERAAFYREMATSMYSVDAYAFSWFLAEIPYITLVVGK